MSPNGPEARALTRDELQWWLNDHIGDSLNIAVVVEGRGPFVLAGHGELGHWSQEAPTSAASGDRPDDIAGLYKVGDWTLDVTELEADSAGGLIALGGGAEQIEILLAEEVSLEITRRPE